VTQDPAGGIAVAGRIPGQFAARPVQGETEPDRFAGAPVGDAPRRGERGGQQQAPAAGALGGDQPMVWHLGDLPVRVAVADHDLDGAVGQPAGHLDRRARVYHGVGHQLAGQQHRIIQEPVRVPGAGHLPRLQRVADKTSGRGGRLRLGLVCRGCDENVRSHAPIVTDSGIVSVQFSEDAREPVRGGSSRRP
jgi:hypothetical protein